MDELAGKVVLVSGGTKGIGAGIVEHCVRAGGRVVFSGKDSAAGESLVSKLEAEGGEAHFVQGDMSIVEDCRSFVGAAEKRYGRVDGLVNNAAVFPRGTLPEADEDQFDTVFAVNVKGPYFCTSFALQAMKRCGCGAIVNIGSTHAWAGSTNLAAYACSKGALHTLTMHVARNYARDRIRSNWVTVGWVETPGEIERLEREGLDTDWLRAQGKLSIPLGRLQTPADIAHAVVYLLSDQAAQVTGTVLDVSGGLVPS